MQDCIFCKIVNGEIPASIIYEDEHVIAFDDIAPQAPVHSLIVPRAHVTNLNDDVSAEVLSQVFGVVSQIAAIKGVQDSGYRVVQNNGPDSGQTVYHLHVHVLGGRAFGEGLV